MNTKKINTTIFKEDADFVIEEVDINDPKIQQEIEKIQKEQAKIHDRKNIELSTLNLVIQL